MEQNKEFYSLIKKVKQIAVKNNLKNYEIDYNILKINNIMWNTKEHLVSKFKDYLIFDELSEFFITFFPIERSFKKLKELFNYYNESSFIFPNYTSLPESKYIYRNIIKKQRVIDEQENLEELKLKQKKLKEKKKNIFYEFYNDSEYESKFFNSSIYNSILKPSESLIKILFGIDNKNKIDNKSNTNNISYYLNKNFINNNNSLKSENEYDNEDNIEEYYNKENLEEIFDNNKDNNSDNEQCIYDEELEEIRNIIKIIHKYEKKKKVNMSIKDFINNNKNNSKIKIKLGLIPNNEQINNTTNIGKIGTNILKANNLFKKYINNGNNNNIIKQNKKDHSSDIYHLKNNNKNNIRIFNFKNKTKIELNESNTNSDINKPLVITNYNNKKNNIKNQNHQKFK